MWKWIPILGILVAGCDGDSGKDDDDGTPGIPNGPDGDECGETPPVIESFTIEDAGMREYDEGLFPSIGLSVQVTDADADLTYYTYRVFWDDVVDGAVDGTGYYAETYGSIDGDDCSVGSVTLTMYLGLAGGSKSPPYSTETEFGAVVMDELNHKSADGEPFVAVYTTPDSDGNY